MCTCNYKKFNTPFEFRAISWVFLKKRTKHILPELFSTFNMKRMIYRAIFQFILLVYPFHPLNKCIQDIMVSTAKYIRFALTMHIFIVIFFFDWFLLHNTLNQSTESPKVWWVMTVSERFGQSSSLVLHNENIWLNKIETLWTKAEKQTIQILKSASH